MAEHFASDWLALRESVDHRARAEELLEPLLAWWKVEGARRGDPALSVVDLGCGTGSNLRYLAPRLPSPQRWTLVDHDAALLERVEIPAVADLAVSRLRRDLTNEEAAPLASSAAGDAPAGLVTASALFDLVSERWLGQLVEAVAQERAAALFTLSYDGNISWGDTDPDDEVVRLAVNEHQLGEKGFGAALGPRAGDAIEAAFQRAGYRTFRASSPWEIGSEEAELAGQLVAGWCTAAAELRPDREAVIRSWGERRLAAVQAGTSRLSVGHVDVLALPPS